MMKRASSSSSPGPVLSTHLQTGVNRVHDANITGAGIRIAVVDTGFAVEGVDALSQTHIAYTRNVVDGNDALDNCSLHGTHVLGIIGAASADRKYGILGVAPDATYELYKISNCNGNEETDFYIQAFLEAADRRVDMITCSAGLNMDWPNEAWTLVANRIVDSGIYITFSAGNQGPGPFSGKTPAFSAGPSSVGSAENSETPLYTMRVPWTSSNSSGSLSVVPGYPFNFSGIAEQGLSLFYPAGDYGLPPLSTGCVRLPADFTLPTDPRRTILLQGPGDCWAFNETSDISDLRIAHLLVYTAKDDDLAEDDFLVAEDDGPGVVGVATVFYPEAQKLISLLRSGPVNITFPVGPAALVSVSGDVFSLPYNRTAGLVSPWSSWGPSLDARSKPTFIAPGRHILSSFPASMGGVGSISGTSMSGPFGAGVAALVKQVHPDMSPAQIQSALALTAVPVRHSSWSPSSTPPGGFDFLAPVLAQGGGMLDAWAAVHATTRVNVSSLSFNDTAHRPASLSFEMTNAGTNPVEYILSHVGAGSGYLLNATNKYEFTQIGVGEVMPVYATIDITPKTLTIAPGSSAVVSVSITAEPHLPEAETRGSYYGGFINMSTTDPGAPRLSLPYTGFGSPLVRLPAIKRNPHETYLASIYHNPVAGAKNRDEPMPIPSGREFLCSYSSSERLCSFPADNEYPALALVFMIQPFRYIFEVVRSADKMVVIPDFFSGGALEGKKGSTRPWAPGDRIFWDGSDGNYTFLEAGTYRFRVKALRLFGQIDREEDYDVIESGEWVLKYSNNSVGLPRS